MRRIIVVLAVVALMAAMMAFTAGVALAHVSAGGMEVPNQGIPAHAHANTAVGTGVLEHVVRNDYIVWLDCQSSLTGCPD